MAVDLGSVEKNPTALGGRGVPFAISTPAQKTRGDFCIAKKLKKLSAPPCLGEALKRVLSYFDTISLF
jgi:hypothetical protein